VSEQLRSSNIIDLREWFEGQSPSGNCRNGFATSRECVDLLRAFTQIADPAFRHGVIRAAHEAASMSRSESPDDKA
jgi:hypothetical protein